MDRKRRECPHYKAIATEMGKRIALYEAMCPDLPARYSEFLAAKAREEAGPTVTVPPALGALPFAPESTTPTARARRSIMQRAMDFVRGLRRY